MKLISQDEDEVLISARTLVRTMHAISIHNVDDEQVWLPLSKIEIVSAKAGVYEILMPIWLAEDKGII